MTTQQLTRTTDDQPTTTPTSDTPRVVASSTRTRRVLVAAAAGAAAIAAIATGAALVAGRTTGSDAPASAVLYGSVPTVGEAVHGGPGSQHDAQAAAYAGLGLPGAEGPTAHGGAGTVGLTDVIRLHRSGYVVRSARTTATTDAPATTDRSRLDRLVRITTP